MSEHQTERAFVALGSNIEPEYHLPEATRQLRSVGKMLAVSSAYQSRAVGDRQQADFVNAAVLLEVSHEPAVLRDLFREIESSLGRVRTEDKYASRTIDLDLVLLGDRVDSKNHLPDPELLTRAHLAIPVAELDPDFCHPITHEALNTIAARLGASELQLREEISQRLSTFRSEAGSSN